MIKLNNIYNKDCLEGMKDIPDQSVNLILCDLPYGTASKNKSIKWDTIIPFEPLWEQYKRILKEDGNIVLTASQPFTSMLVASNYEWFRYEWIWMKSKKTQFLTAKLMPLKQHENILVFTKHPIAPAVKVKSTYNPQGLILINEKKTQKHKGSSSCISGRGNYEGKEFIKEFTNYPTSILSIANEGKTIHPTQKPLELFEYIVETYSNEGDLVLDNCIGSGTTAVVCINTKRKFIGYENEDNIFNLAKNRVNEHIISQNMQEHYQLIA